MTFPALTLVTIGLAVLVGWLAYRLLRVILWLLGRVFTGIGFLLKRVANFARREVVDSLHSVGALATGLAILPLTIVNLLIGRVRAAGYYGGAVKNELAAALLGIYRVGLSNPLRFLGAGILLDGFERRLPELVEQAPSGARKSRTSAQEFEGYQVFGRLPEGGSGAQLFLAYPTKETEERLGRTGVLLPREVVIKSFAVARGSTLPQIVRESRALEAARRLGLVLDHSLSEERFYYVMPYVRGDELNAVVHRMHANADPEGLADGELARVLSLGSDLMYQLERFHRGGLWHKDIKPNNLIVASDGRAYLVDFGLVTPLASAMTLTTHGTEYYRDPEMVRLALRGVKVHEVDGVKFDLYSAGAVLFSMVENSFPAQGNLTRLTKRCPEALAWIIRRAMADMRTRYGSAREMLQDLACVQANSDPWSVRPADLPSFRASLEREEGAAAELASLAEPPVGDDAELFPGFTPPPVFPQAGTFPQEPEPEAPTRERASRRKRLLRAVPIAAGVLVAMLFVAEMKDRRNPFHPGSLAARNAPEFWESPRFDPVERKYLQFAEELAEQIERAKPRPSSVSVSFPDSHSAGVMDRLDPFLPDTGKGPYAESERRATRTNQGPRLLVLEDAARTLEDDVAQMVRKAFEENGMRVFDRRTESDGGPEAIELFAGARHAIGLSGVEDQVAVEKLQRFLDRTTGVDAILWVARGAEPDKIHFHLLTRS